MRPRKAAAGHYLPGDGDVGVYTWKAFHLEVLEATKPGRGWWQLVREPDNKADPNAVLVCSPEGPLGYLPREWAALIAPVIKAAEPVPLFADTRLSVSRGERQVLVRLPLPKRLKKWARRRKLS